MAGIVGDEIESGLFEGEAVSLQLVGVRGPGMSLYATDAFGAPQVFFDSEMHYEQMCSQWLWEAMRTRTGVHRTCVYKVDVQAQAPW